MSGFIEVICSDGRKRLLNIRHIEEVVENATKDGCFIFMAFNCPDAIEQDYFEVKESYDAIIQKISDAVILNAYAMVQSS
jgi:uncharacterized protein YlzI (FlbEa/FlbD family)